MIEQLQRRKVPLPSDLSDRDCEVWLIDLAIDSALEQQFYHCLAADEQARADRLSQPQARRDFIATRSALRSILSEQVGCAMQALSLDYGQQGKPRLVQGPPLEFNVSHSQGKALIGIARSTAIGIDLEKVRSMPKLLALTERFYAVSEHQAIASLDESKRARAFFEYWTCKEAYLKGTGDGISKVQKLELAITPDRVEILNYPCDRRFQLLQLPLDEGLAQGFVGAIAIAQD